MSDESNLVLFPAPEEPEQPEITVRIGGQAFRIKVDVSIEEIPVNRDLKVLELPINPVD